MGLDGFETTGDVMNEVPFPDCPGVNFKAIDGFPGYCVGDDGSVWMSLSFRNR